MVTNIYCDIKANSASSVTLLDGRTLGMVEVTIAYRERRLEGLACISHHPTVEAHDTTARASLRLLAVLDVLFKYACARLFPPPGSRLVLTPLSRTSTRHLVRNAGKFFIRPRADHTSGKHPDRCQHRLTRRISHQRPVGSAA